MAEHDTICLLKECDSGIQMGIQSINETLQDVQDANVVRILQSAREEHEALQKDCVRLLAGSHDTGKSPSILVQGMGKVKTAMKMAVSSDTSRTAAGLITDGCNMGIKSLNRYLNEYKNASAQARSLAQRLIHSEEKLLDDLKGYL